MRHKFCPDSEQIYIYVCSECVSCRQTGSVTYLRNLISSSFFSSSLMILEVVTLTSTPSITNFLVRFRVLLEKFWEAERGKRNKCHKNRWRYIKSEIEYKTSLHTSLCVFERLELIKLLLTYAVENDFDVYNKNSSFLNIYVFVIPTVVFLSVERRGSCLWIHWQRHLDSGQSGSTVTRRKMLHL